MLALAPRVVAALFLLLALSAALPIAPASAARAAAPKAADAIESFVDLDATALVFPADGSAELQLGLRGRHRTPGALLLRIVWLDPFDNELLRVQREFELRRGTTRVPIPLDGFGALTEVQLRHAAWHRLRIEIDGAARALHVPVGRVAADAFLLTTIDTSGSRRSAVWVVAIHPFTGTPVAGVELEFAELHENAPAGADGEPRIRRAVTDADGVARFEGISAEPGAVPEAFSGEVEISGRLGVFRHETSALLYSETDPVIALAPERPLYRPGETVRARAVALAPDGRAVAAAPLRFTLVNDAGDRIASAETVTSTLGVAHTELALVESLRDGDYTLKAELLHGDDVAARESAVLEIARYELPWIVSTVRSEKPYHLPGENAFVEARATAPDGRPVPGARFEFFAAQEEPVRRPSARDGDPDPAATPPPEPEVSCIAGRDGRCRVEIDLGDAHRALAARGSWQLFVDRTWSVRVTDPVTLRTLESSLELRATREELHVRRIGYEEPPDRLPGRIMFSVLSADGLPVEADLVVRLDPEDYDDKPLRPVFLRARSGPFGLAWVEIPSVAKAWYADVRVTATDDRGRTGRVGDEEETDEDIYWEASAVELRPARTLLQRGRPIELTVWTRKPSAPVRVELVSDGGARASLRVRTRDHRAALSIPWQDGFADVVRAVAFTPSIDLEESDELERDAAEAWMLLPRGGRLGLQAGLEPDRARPGEPAAATFRVRDGEGRPVRASVGAVVLDTALEARLREDGVPDAMRWFLARSEDSWPGSRPRYAGVSLADLRSLDPDVDHDPAFDRLAWVLLQFWYFAPSREWSSWESVNESLYRDALRERIAPIAEAFEAYRAANDDTLPATEQGIRELLTAAGLLPDEQLDCWGSPFRLGVETWGASRAVELYSNGPDRQSHGGDDIRVHRESWSWFAPTAKKLEVAAAALFAREAQRLRPDTGALLELARAQGLRDGDLVDPWGTSLRWSWKPDGSVHRVELKSLGPDRVPDPAPDEIPEGTYIRRDDFTLWRHAFDTFEPLRPRVLSALVAASERGDRFPENREEFHSALQAFDLDPASLRDVWGRPYLLRFFEQVEWGDTVTVDAASGDEARTQVEPRTLRQRVVVLASAGPDGHPDRYAADGPVDDEGDDVQVGLFEGTVVGLLTDVDPDDVARASEGEPGMVVVVVEGPDGPLEDAIVTLVSREGARRARTTDRRGQVTFWPVEPGAHDVAAEFPGMAKRVVVDVRVVAGSATRVRARLEPGTVEMSAVHSDADGYGLMERVGVTSEPTIFANEAIGEATIDDFAPYVSDVRIDEPETGPPGSRGDQALRSTPRVRRDFPDTLLWAPDVETGPDGDATLSFTLADTVTTWRLQAVASTAEGLLATSSDTLVATQPLAVELDLPSDLTVGDRLQLPLVVTNRTGATRDVDLRLELPDALDPRGPPSARAADVPDGEAADRTFEIEARGVAREAPVRAQAHGGGESDSVQRGVSIRPAGRPTVETQAGIVRDGWTATIDVAARDANPGFEARLTIAPDLSAQLADAARATLRRPWGCTEQIASSGLAHVRAGRAEHVRTAVHMLADRRAEAGGYAYWSGRDVGDPVLTAWVLRFLAEAAPDAEVDRAAWDDDLLWLLALQDADGGWDADAERADAEKADDGEDPYELAQRTVWIADALARAREAAPWPMPEPPPAAVDPQLPPTVERRPPPTVEQALERALDLVRPTARNLREPFLVTGLGALANRLGREDDATWAESVLRDRVRGEGDGAYWYLETNTPLFGWGRAGRIEATARAAAFLAERVAARTEASDPLLDRVGLWLLRRQDRYGGWWTTPATVAALEALGALLEGGLPADDLRVLVDGEEVARFDLSDLQRTETREIDLVPHLRPGAREIRVVADEPANRIVARITTVRHESWHAPAPPAAPDTLDLEVVFDTNEPTAGMAVRCDVRVERSGFRGRGMLIAEIGLPPGAEVDRTSLDAIRWETGLRDFDVRPDRVVLYLWPRAGGAKLSFTFRARLAGSFLAAPSAVWDFYNPDASRMVEPARFTVRQSDSGIPW